MGLSSLSSIADCYERLGLSQHPKPDLATIRSCYRKLALQYHPDKCRHMQPKEAASQFADITEAYKRVSDHVQGKSDLRCFQEEAAASPFTAWFMWAMWAAMAAWSERPKPIEVTLPVTLQDLFNKGVKKIRIKVQRWNEALLSLEARVETVYISLFHYEKKHVIEGAGDDPPRFFESMRTRLRPEQDAEPLKENRGHVVVTLDIQYHPAYYVLDMFSPYDLGANLHVNLYQYYYADKDTVFKLPSLSASTESTLAIPYVPGTESITLKGQGLPYYDFEEACERRGDLFVRFELQLPSVEAMEHRTDFQEALASFLQNPKP